MFGAEAYFPNSGLVILMSFLESAIVQQKLTWRIEILLGILRKLPHNFSLMTSVLASLELEMPVKAFYWV